MKFIAEVIIDKPQHEVVAIFSNPELMHHYHDGFQEKKLLAGVAGQKGAVSLLHYKMKGGSDMHLEETVMENDLPNSFLANYVHDHTENTMLSSFTQLDSDTTKYTIEIHYTAFKGIMVNIIKTLFPSMFKKQVQKMIQKFKYYVESQ